MTKKIKVSLVKSVIGTRKDHKQTVIGLGLRRINDSRLLEDTPCIRGMVSKVSYLLSVEDVV